MKWINNISDIEQIVTDADKMYLAYLHFLRTQVTLSKQAQSFYSIA